MHLTEFNGLPDEQARGLLEQCASIPAWSRAVVAERPFVGRDELLARAEELAGGWTWEDVTAAMADHPRIGERRSSDDELARLSRAEQSGVSNDADTKDRLLEGNLAYEQRFGRVFLIRAAGRGQEEVLGELRRRLGNDEATEWGETTEQLRQIALLRLGQAVQG